MTAAAAAADTEKKNGDSANSGNSNSGGSGSGNDGSGQQQEWDFLLHRLAANAALHPSKVAMAFVTPGPNGGKLSTQNTFTYSQMEQETSELAARLLASGGMVRGDR
jgi:hypothetical protein